MKKIKYYETLREKTEEGKHQFEEYEGWYEAFYDSETNTKINVVLRKDDNLLWKATHLDSGILITSGYVTKKSCLEKIMSVLNKVARVLSSDKTILSVIQELEEHRNGVLQNDFK